MITHHNNSGQQRNTCLCAQQHKQVNISSSFTSKTFLQQTTPHTHHHIKIKLTFALLPNPSATPQQHLQMLSKATIVQLLGSLLFLSLIAFSDNDHRLAIIFPLLWVLGSYALTFFQHHRHASTVNRAFLVFVGISFLGLSAFNDLFYYNVIGRTLDIWFDRDPYDDEVPGSGFTDFYETFWRCNGQSIIDSLCAIRNTILTISFMLGAIGMHAFYHISKRPRIEHLWQWIDEHPGEPLPAWHTKIPGREHFPQASVSVGDVEPHTWGPHERVYDFVRPGGGPGLKLEDYHAEACYNRRRAMEGLRPVKFFA